jgi:predicted metal-dependent hydrolase
MSKKSPKIAALIEGCHGRGRDPYYLGYFECFNQGLFYEAHDVLEEAWLKNKQSPNYSFYKGLIQLAGAFVHLQKDRLKPAVALFNLAEANISRYPDLHEGLDNRAVLNVIIEWKSLIAQHEFCRNPLLDHPCPLLSLQQEVGQ